MGVNRTWVGSKAKAGIGPGYRIRRRRDMEIPERLGRPGLQAFTLPPMAITSFFSTSQKSSAATSSNTLQPMVYSA